ncbi:MAG: alkaline phosphatase family protein [Dehalococcoidia bacterium]
MLRSSLQLILLAVLLLMLGSAILISTSGVGRMAMSGGVEELREPLRQVRGETRVLLVGLDGVGELDLYQAIRDGSMPNVSSLVGAVQDTMGLWEHGYGAREVMSVLPAETTAGWAAILTGARPSDSGVPGNEWFIRDSLAFFAPVPLSVDSYAHTLEIYSSELVGDRIQVPTLFERVGDLRSHVTLGFVSRGADVLSPPNFSQLPLLLKSLVDAA